MCVQSFLTLYTSCVRELVQLLKACRNAHPQPDDPTAPFASKTEMRVQSLVRPAQPLRGLVEQLRHRPHDACIFCSSLVTDWGHFQIVDWTLTPCSCVQSV